MNDWTDIDEAVRVFFETLLWSETDGSTPEGGDPLDENYTLDDVAAKSVAGVRADLEAFLEQARTILEAEPERGHWPHDFCLTCNRHGAGFWDGDYERGDELTALCREFGEYNAYVGDGGRVYVLGM